MIYKSIINTKPKKENKKQFCKRIYNLISPIEVYINGNIYIGMEAISKTFIYSKHNNGYSSIDDLLAENGISGGFDKLQAKEDYNIKEMEILANIEILINSIFWIHEDFHAHPFNAEARDNVKIIINACGEYLLTNGYKFIENGDKLVIIENEIAIDINNIENKDVENEILNFYDYKNSNNNDEKKKIIVNIYTKHLEPRINEIESIFGKNISSILGSYVNNINLRHNNTVKNNKQKYKETIANLSIEELNNWYDYIFAFIINIYMNLDKLKDIKINDNYKVSN